MTVAIPARLNLAEYCLAEAAAQTPGKDALVVVRNAQTGEASERWTFAAFEDCVLRVAGGLLDAGFKPGDRLLIRLDNTSTFPILFLAAVAAGIVAIPASSQLTAEEASFLLADSEAHGTLGSVGDASAAGSAPIVVTGRCDQATTTVTTTTVPVAASM